MHRILAFLFSVALLSGCTSNDYRGIYFANSHRQVSPIRTGSVPDPGFALPVYREWPPRPYNVIGKIKFNDKLKADWTSNETALAVRICREKGGDALIVRPGDLGAPEAFPALAAEKASGEWEKQIAALVIKWKSKTELDAERRWWDGLQKRLKAGHPVRAVNSEFMALARDYSAYHGFNLESATDAKILENDLSAIFAAEPDTNACHWLFQGKMSVNIPLTSYSTTFYGVAISHQDGDAISIDCSSTNVVFHFAGKTAGGRLSGSLETLNCKTHAEGSRVPDRISLDCRGENQDEMIRGSFVFLK